MEGGSRPNVHYAGPLVTAKRTKCDCAVSDKPPVLGPSRSVRTRLITRSSYAWAMSVSVRIERGWIFVDGTRQDDGTIELGTRGEMRFSPFEAMSQRQVAQITWGHILTASVQRLAFWRR